MIFTLSYPLQHVYHEIDCNVITELFSTLQMGIRYCNVFSFSLHAVLGVFATQNIDFSDNIFFPVKCCYCRLARPTL